MEPARRSAATGDGGVSNKGGWGLNAAVTSENSTDWILDGCSERLAIRPNTPRIRRTPTPRLPHTRALQERGGTAPRGLVLCPSGASLDLKRRRAPPFPRSASRGRPPRDADTRVSASGTRARGRWGASARPRRGAPRPPPVGSARRQTATTRSSSRMTTTPRSRRPTPRRCAAAFSRCGARKRPRARTPPAAPPPPPSARRPSTPPRRAPARPLWSGRGTIGRSRTSDA